MPVGERAQRRVRFRSVVSPTVTSPYAASDFFSPVFPESLDEELSVNPALNYD
ncbi:hypothetical protein S245_020633 [Arachis hypogaea]